MWRLDLASVEEQARSATELITDGMLRRTPTKAQMHAEGPEGLLVGWVPSEPLIRPQTRVIAFGSCFAARFAEWLAEHDFNRAFDSSSDQSIVRNQLETPSVVAQQFRWAFGELDPEHAFWIGPDKRRFEATEDRRLRLRDTLVAAEVLIITFGISEMWVDTVTGEPIWRVPPRELQGTNRYALRVATAAESIAALETIHRLRGTHMPGSKILYTVSPQRHTATFRGISPIVANVASKAILTVAVDEFLRAHPAELNRTYFYFPAFEIVTQLFRDPLLEDNRHLGDDYVALLMDVFAHHYAAATMASGERPRYPSSPEDELHERIAKLEVARANLQRVCDERLAVIEAIDAELKRVDRPGAEPPAGQRRRLAESATRLAGGVLRRLLPRA
jgi:hypothetical protein